MLENWATNPLSKELTTKTQNPKPKSVFGLNLMNDRLFRPKKISFRNLLKFRKKNSKNRVVRKSKSSVYSKTIYSNMEMEKIWKIQ